MNEKQLELIMDIIQEQLSDYLADELAADIFGGIAEAIGSQSYILIMENQPNDVRIFLFVR